MYNFDTEIYLLLSMLSSHKEIKHTLLSISQLSCMHSYLITNSIRFVKKSFGREFNKVNWNIKIALYSK